MKPTFTLDVNRRAQSDIRRKLEPHTITVGTPIVLSAPYRTGLGVVPAGAKGFVSSVDETNGDVWILMEGIEPALALWDNEILLRPYDTEDVLPIIEFQPVPSVARRRLGDYWRMVVTFLLIH
jgi:hypothetical protein